MVQVIQDRLSFFLKVMIIGVSLVAMAWAAADPAPKPKKVPGKEQQSKLVNKVVPEYPAEAKAQGIAGKVRLQALIAENGTVKELKVISGKEPLVKAAVTAVKQWTYQPTMINGKPVEVLTDIDVNFELAP